MISFTRPQNLRKAFTLIELLVVIAIIAILAAILFPVFAQAKLAAKETVAISDMKQIALASQMYLNDNDDNCAPMAYIPKGTADFIFQTWSFAWDLNTNVVDLKQGLFYPYMKSGQIEDSPLVPPLGLSYIPIAYGMNTFVYNPDISYNFTSVSATSADKPAETLLLADAANVFGPNRTWQICPGCSTLAQARISDLVTIAWLDGHASKLHVTIPTNTRFGVKPATWAANHIGDLLKFPATSPNCNSPMDEYYYEFSKPAGT